MKNSTLEQVRIACNVEIARVLGNKPKVSFFWNDDSARDLVYECQTNYEIELVKGAWYKANREK